MKVLRGPERPIISYGNAQAARLPGLLYSQPPRLVVSFAWGSGMGSALKHTPTSGHNAPMATRFVGWVRVGGSPDVSCNVSESLLRFTHLYYLLLLASGPLSRLTLALNGIVLQRLLVAMASRLTKELSAPPCVLLSLSHCATHNWAPLSLVLMTRRWRWFFALCITVRALVCCAVS